MENCKFCGSKLLSTGVCSNPMCSSTKNEVKDGVRRYQSKLCDKSYPITEDVILYAKDSASLYINYDSIVRRIDDNNLNAIFEGILAHFDMFNLGIEEEAIWFAYAQSSGSMAMSPSDSDTLSKVAKMIAEMVIVDLLSEASAMHLQLVNVKSNDKEKYLKPDGTVRKTVGSITDHAGNKFNSFTDMCNFYNINHYTVRKRLYDGLSLEEALVTARYLKQTGVVTDHLGKLYPNLTIMCRAYGTVADLYKLREERGCSKEDCLSPYELRF